MDTKIDLSYADNNIFFRISSCSYDKKYSFYKMNTEEAKRFLGRLKHLEKMTWRQLVGLDRKDGLTPEKVNTDSYNMIDIQNTSEDKILNKYYFHLRIEKEGVFRIFGYQDKNMFCITHIDKDGVIHHS